jgi:protein TonB
MLENSLFESAGRRKTHAPFTLLTSLAVHGLVIGVLVLVPLIQMQAVPIPRIDAALWIPRVEPRTEIELVAPQNSVRHHVEVDPEAVIAPQSIPKEVAYVIDAPSIPSLNSTRSSIENGIGSILREMRAGESEETAGISLPPAPPSEPIPSVEPQPVRKGGTIQQANLIHQVLPSYPPLARQARIQGIVVLEAVINKQGMIETLRVVSGHPLLNQAAIDAVKQWMYKPTLLNGEPVAVITTVTVSFSLQ